MPDRALAVVEIAEAAGIELLAPHERDASITSTTGVGELIRAALDRGAEEILVGLGGSATNDAGAGMLTVLGARFLDEKGQELEPGGLALARLAHIGLESLDERLRTARVIIASDVTNPLLGTSGASHVFGPQKGADVHAVAALDEALSRWADIAEGATGRSVRELPGAGAAGGLGAAFLAFTDAIIQPGAEFVMDQLGINERLSNASLVLTGEGSWDAQSAAGKAPAAVAARAASKGVPALIFAGRVGPSDTDAHPEGVISVVPIVRDVCDLQQALTNAAANLEAAVATALEILSQPWQEK